MSLSPSPKGEHLDVKAVGQSSSAVQQCFVAFDVLLVDGQNLANKPQQERADILSTWVGRGGREGSGGEGREGRVCAWLLLLLLL